MNFYNISIYTIDNFGLISSNHYVMLPAAELKRKIDFAKAKQYYRISYKDKDGKEHLVEKKNATSE